LDQLDVTLVDQIKGLVRQAHLNESLEELRVYRVLASQVLLTLDDLIDELLDLWLIRYLVVVRQPQYQAKQFGACVKLLCLSYQLLCELNQVHD